VKISNLACSDVLTLAIVSLATVNFLLSQIEIVAIAKLPMYILHAFIDILILVSVLHIGPIQFSFSVPTSMRKICFNVFRNTMSNNL
jgi:hypothetical protein